MTIPVSQGKVVFITYSIKNQQGEFFESSDVPVGYIQGSDKGLFLPVEAALEGKMVGEQVSVTLMPNEAYGPRDPSLSFTDDMSNVPPEFHRIGAEVQFQNEQGESKTFYVTKIENGKLTVDANHPLAGQNVTFYVKVADVRNPTAEEIKTGEPEQDPAINTGSVH
ncbi:FKBP-type peptidyl-prolyl cis-trans isomerase [Candidatus Venteria ishoeyi]|uniref:peptidylprolyl isomerase n=1 Tax=Candidatus Venteria ishoeyi TaxID=1899563 RepID=A0A1H6FH89_9GAMM|nr:FKBP-type peptidyl-prolyl cis-trans isomerase [Candidatus Venteria ishoeyi]MDM8547377.1 FKBP-type peptidyl-prolyl cis-trans isomerase [Candidatus Venteria ishoeyi]SEH08729.1 FKBP-type peptidyl-prolyl cis-trans isomerase SlyD [Candidatus Venteria ishoeyi]